MRPAPTVDTKRRFFRKLVLYFFGVSTLLIIVFGGLIVSRSIRAAQADFGRFSAQLLSSTSQFAESRVRAAMSMAVAAFNTGEVASYIYQSEQSAVDEQLAQREIRNQMAQNDSIHSVYLYNRQAGVYSRVGSLVAATSPVEAIYQEHLDEDFDGFWKVIVFDAFSDEARVTPLYLVTLIVKEYAWKTGLIERAIIINLTEASFLRTPVSPTWEGFGQLYIVDSDGVVLSAFDKRHLGADFSRLPAVARVLANETEVGTLEAGSGEFLGETPHLVSFVRNKALGWTFLQVTDRFRLRREYYQILSSTLLLVLPFLVVAIAIAYWLAGRLYRPIAAILSGLQRRPAGSRSGERTLDELEIIGESIRDMSDEIRKLTDSATRQTDAELAELVHRALTHSLTPEDRARFDTEVGARFPGFPVVLVTVASDVCEDGQQPSLADPPEVSHLKLLNTIRVWCRARPSVLIVSHGPVEASLVLPLSGSIPVGDARKQVASLLDSIRSAVGVSFSAGTSEPISSVEDLADAADVTADLLRYRKILGRGQLLSVHDISLYSATDFEYPVELEERIVGAIRSGREAEFASGVDALFDYLKRFDVDHFEYASSQVMLNVIKEMNVVLRLAKLPAFVGYDQVGRLGCARGIDEHAGLFVGLYRRYQEHHAVLARSRTPRSELTVSRVKRVVEENLSNRNLDLSLIAAELHLSSNYLSRLFKDETGTNLTAYIRDRRMDLARELLASEPSLPVGEIAVRCGYSDINYFSYSFRASVGVSPSTYRAASGEGSGRESGQTTRPPIDPR